MTDPARDENGLTEMENRCWLLQYRALADIVGAVVVSAPSEREARRRIELIRSDIAEIEARLADIVH